LPRVLTTLGVVALNGAAAPSIGVDVGDRTVEDRSIACLAMKLRASHERQAGLDREPIGRRQPASIIFKRRTLPLALLIIAQRSQRCGLGADVYGD